LGKRILITRRGSLLGSLKEPDIIETGLEKNDRHTPWATIELPVHRAVYLKTNAQAIVHAHPPHAVALSMTETEIIPNGNSTEEKGNLGKVTVIGSSDTDCRPGNLAEKIADNLLSHRIVLVYGHGTFASGQLLEDAYRLTAAFEEACQIIWLVKTLDKKVI
jgi:L-fuculose-phosphate aldolase